MSSTSPDSPIDIILGLLVIGSFITFAFLVASLRTYVDENKIGEEKNIAGIMASQIPPERILTTVGKRRMKLAKYALGACALLIAVVFVRWQIR